VDQTGMVRLATAPPIDAVSSLTFPIMTPPRMVVHRGFVTLLLPSSGMGRPLRGSGRPWGERVRSETNMTVRRHDPADRSRSESHDVDNRPDRGESIGAEHVAAEADNERAPMGQIRRRHVTFAFR
jgi:hypothetical protein